MKKLNFYDLKRKKSFQTDKYELDFKKTPRGIRYFAIAITPSGRKSHRIVSKDFYLEFKD